MKYLNIDRQQRGRAGQRLIRSRVARKAGVRAAGNDDPQPMAALEAMGRGVQPLLALTVRPIRTPLPMTALPAAWTTP